MTTILNTGATTSETTPAPEGHDAKMVERFEQSQQLPKEPAAAAETSTPAIPEGFPAKFVKDGKPDYEALARSYTELEQKQSGPKTEETKVEAPKPGDLKIEPEVKEAQETLENAGLNFDEFSDEFAKSGELSEASYEKLTKAGIPKQFVDAFIDGQVAKAQALRADVVGSVGGEEKFSEMVSWAQKNVSKAELEAYNAAVDSGSIEQVKLAVTGMYAKFSEAGGAEPSLIQGSNTPAAGDVFNDMSELKAAMKDPKYAVSEAYRQQVQAKLARSSIM